MNPETVYVPWLHMHQPNIHWTVDRKHAVVSNLQKMLMAGDSQESWDARLIARAYKNPAKYVKELNENGCDAKIMLDYSGILLEGLAEMGESGFLDDAFVDGEKVGDIIKLFRALLNKYPESVEFAGTAYSHCYFPATPEDDWNMQIEEWKNVFKKLFGGKALSRVKGFWLPEMGVPQFENSQEKLIKVVSEHYEWMILPLQSIAGYEALSLEKRIKLACAPHILRVKSQTIPVIFRMPEYFLDQQSGVDATGVYGKAREASKVSNLKKPAMVVPVSDGENGNVMMNEFFPKTFVPFFTKLKDKKVSSMTVTEFLHTYYEKNGSIQPEDEITVKNVGASWIGTHRNWLEGSKRLEMIRKVEVLSKMFHEVEDVIKKNEKEFEVAKKKLLVAETSCYVYWDSEFWYSQGDLAINDAKISLGGAKRAV